MEEDGRLRRRRQASRPGLRLASAAVAAGSRGDPSLAVMVICRPVGSKDFN